MEMLLFFVVLVQVEPSVILISSVVDSSVQKMLTEYGRACGDSQNIMISLGRN